MNNITKIDRLILNILYKSSGKLETYNVFKRSRVGFKTFSLSVRRLTENALLIEIEGTLSLTQTGKDIVLTASPKNNESKEWRSVPLKFKIPQIAPNEPYIPSIKLLDRRSFT
jgi:predicted methyltransferase